MNPRLTPTHALSMLARNGNGQRWIGLFEHGSLAVEFYQPRGTDPQAPHARDEVYVVIAGRGEFVCGGQRQPVEAGELLFAAAGVAHRFENFSDDFSTWVLFYGPEGGEAGATHTATQDPA